MPLNTIIIDAITMVGLMREFVIAYYRTERIDISFC
jgi:hypothetical protein